MAESGRQPDGSWRPVFPGQRPPFEPGNPGGGRPATHAAYSEKALGPLREAIFVRVVEVAPTGDPADEPMQREYANLLARSEMAHRYLDEHGLVDERGNPRPILTELVKWERAATGKARELGMTPLSRADLRLDQVRAMSELVSLGEVRDALKVAMGAAVELLPRELQARYLEAVNERLGGLEQQLERGGQFSPAVGELEP